MYRHQLYHEILYRYHVLRETSLPDTGFSPYYEKKFFALLFHYHENNDLNRLLMSPGTVLHLAVERQYTSWSETCHCTRVLGITLSHSSGSYNTITSSYLYFVI